MAPRDHRIHLGRTDSLKAPPQNHSSTKQLFSGPFFAPKISPGQNVDPGIQNPILEVQNPILGAKICRKTMQNPALGIANGAIWWKLWPKTIFEPKPEDLGCLLGTILEAHWAMET